MIFSIIYVISITANSLARCQLQRILARVKLTHSGMNENQWSAIPSKLRAEGFSVLFDRISYEPERPLWCARACRGGHQWNTFGKDLSTALVELGRQTMEAPDDWRETIAREKSETDRVFQRAV